MLDPSRPSELTMGRNVKMVVKHTSMKPLAPRESIIINCWEIWPFPMVRLSIEVEAVSIIESQTED